MAVFAPYVPSPSIDCVPLYTSHEFRSPRGILLGGAIVYQSALQPGWKRYEVLRMLGGDLVDIAEGEAPSEAEAERIAKFLVMRGDV